MGGLKNCMLSSRLVRVEYTESYPFFVFFVSAECDVLNQMQEQYFHVEIKIPL